MIKYTDCLKWLTFWESLESTMNLSHEFHCMQMQFKDQVNKINLNFKLHIHKYK